MTFDDVIRYFLVLSPLGVVMRWYSFFSLMCVEMRSLIYIIINPKIKWPILPRSVLWILTANISGLLWEFLLLNHQHFWPSRPPGSCFVLGALKPQGRGAHPVRPPPLATFLSNISAKRLSAILMFFNFKPQDGFFMIIKSKVNSKRLPHISFGHVPKTLDMFLLHGSCFPNLP